MNSNVTKRTSRLSSAGGGKDGNNGTTTKTKRVKRIRRKPKPKSSSSRASFVFPLLLGAFTSLLLVAVTYLVTSNIKSQESINDRNEKNNHNNEFHEGESQHDRAEEKKERKKRMSKYNDLDAENEPLPKSEGGIFSKFHYRKSSNYMHSDYIHHLGDKSVQYSQLRQEYDELLPMDNVERMKEATQRLKKNKYRNLMKHDMPYNVHHCPEDPPPNYPFAWNVRDVLDNWPPDDTFRTHSHVYQGLCVFDYETEKHKAINYRKAEVPFVVQNDPKVMRTVERWNQPGYMDKLLGEKLRYRTEFSRNNHFMYWNNPSEKAKKSGRVPKNWKAPTKMGRMLWPTWVKHANVTDEQLLKPDHEHWYFRLIGCGEMGNCDKDSSEFLFDELGFFQPTEKNDLYMVEPRKQKGIHCRFGMKGVIAENHFDGSRNMIVVLGGERRYILSHPNQCKNLALLPRGHPSARHSAVDWSDPDWEKFPEFSDAEVNEVVMQAGDMLYLPTNWFHYIISLDMNFQCNTRSGVNREYMRNIEDCGF